MSARRLRFSIRHWMMLVTIAAMLLGAGRWAKAWARLHSAQVELQHYQSLYYVEGRVTADALIVRSRRLMEAQFDWYRDHRARIQAIEAHLGRIDVILKQVRKDLEECFCRGCSQAIYELQEAELARDEANVLLAKEKGFVGRRVGQAPTKDNRDE
jgi:hypothetical protein